MHGTYVRGCLLVENAYCNTLPVKCFEAWCQSHETVSLRCGLVALTQQWSYFVLLLCMNHAQKVHRPMFANVCLQILVQMGHSWVVIDMVNLRRVIVVVAQLRVGGTVHRSMHLLRASLHMRSESWQYHCNTRRRTCACLQLT